MCLQKMRPSSIMVSIPPGSPAAAWAAPWWRWRASEPEASG